MPLPIPSRPRAVKLLDANGNQVIHQGTGLPMYGVRCGSQITGLRSDGLPANHMIAVPLGATLPELQPVIEAPGFGDGGGAGGGERGPPLGIGLPRPIQPGPVPPPVVEPVPRPPVATPRLPIYGVRPCAGPPFPFGAHIAMPTRATFDDGAGPKPVFADGCVECAQPPPSCDCCFGELGGIFPQFLDAVFTVTGPGCECFNGYTVRRLRRNQASLLWDNVDRLPPVCGLPTVGFPSYLELRCVFPFHAQICSAFQIHLGHIDSDFGRFLFILAQAPDPSIEVLVRGWRTDWNPEPGEPSHYFGQEYRQSCRPFLAQFRGLEIWSVDFGGEDYLRWCPGLVDITFFESQ